MLTHNQLIKSAERQSSALTPAEKIILAALQAKTIFGETTLDASAQAELKAAYVQAADLTLS